MHLDVTMSHIPHNVGTHTVKVLLAKCHLATLGTEKESLKHHNRTVAETMSTKYKTIHSVETVRIPASNCKKSAKREASVWTFSEL